MISRTVLFAAAATLAATFAAAETTGESEYLNACASCHGVSGTGDGPLAGVLSSAVPDLTLLSQRNDGTFPMLDVIHIIDGRTGITAHGSSKPDWEAGMPVWGARFRDELNESCGPYGAETVVRGRVLMLADYLASIQQ